jgi:DNA polymerase III delta subunit
MVEPHVFIYLGSDESEKLDRIENLQKKLFPPDLKELNYNLYHADDKDLGVAEFKEALMALPTEGVRSRLIVIRSAHKLSGPLKAMLTEALKNNKGRVIVLDVPVSRGTEAFVSEFTKKGARVVRFKEESVPDVFALARSIVDHRPELALRILSALTKSKDKPEGIPGAIFWQWEKSRAERRFSEKVYKDGLKIIFEADKELKSSSSKFARGALILERLVVRLSYLT